MNKIIVILIIMLSGCSATQVVSTDKDRLKQLDLDQLLQEGYKVLIEEKKPKKSVKFYFEKIIDVCEETFSKSKVTFYSARSEQETMYYLLKGMAGINSSGVEVLNSTCGEALFMKGSINITLNHIDIAEEYIKKAIELSPVNSKFLSELGHIYILKKDWTNALEVFSEAEVYAGIYSPNYTGIYFPNNELSRAKRGVGFTLIELNKLSEAQEKYQECLKISQNDRVALDQLKYIKSIVNK